MKKLLIIALLSTFSISSFAQAIDLRRKIEVSGTAEMEVTPDIINVEISLKEYFKDNLKKKKAEIEELEKLLQNAVKKAGIDDADFTIDNISSYNYSYEKKKSSEFLAKKQYRIKLRDLTKLNQILNAIEPKAIEYTNIESYDYSKIETLKRDLKIQALKAAKEKAIYLAAALGDKVGSALNVQEVNNGSNYPQPIFRANMASFDAKESEPAMPDIDFKKIKLVYEMQVVFELIQ